MRVDLNKYEADALREQLTAPSFNEVQWWFIYLGLAHIRVAEPLLGSVQVLAERIHKVEEFDWVPDE